MTFNFFVLKTGLFMLLSLFCVYISFGYRFIYLFICFFTFGYRVREFIRNILQALVVGSAVMKYRLVHPWGYLIRGCHELHPMVIVASLCRGISPYEYVLLKSNCQFLTKRYSAKNKLSKFKKRLVIWVKSCESLKIANDQNTREIQN